MIILNIFLTVKPEFIEQFKTAAITNAHSSRLEPGCLRFDVIQDNEDALKFVLFEVYRDVAAHQAHRETDHYKAWRAATTDIFVERASKQYTAVDVAPF